MSNLIALTTNPSKTAVMLLDASQPYIDLQECAEQRLSAAKGLLYSLACITISHADAKDVNNLADAAYLLLEDANDLFKAARHAALREGRSNA